MHCDGALERVSVVRASSLVPAWRVPGFPMDPRANPDQAVEVQRQWAGILPQLAVARGTLRIITITINPKRDMQDNGGDALWWSNERGWTRWPVVKGQGSGSLNCVMFAFGTHPPLFLGLLTIVAGSKLKYYTFHSKAALCQHQ